MGETVMSLTGKVALVTGASRGIGRAIALRLAIDGAVVAVHYGTNAGAAEETLRLIRSEGGRGFVVQGRLNEIDEIDNMFAAFDRLLAENTGGSRFDILVNNAGIDRWGTIEEITPEVFDEVIRTNVRGPFFLTQRALPRIQDNGRIINISSGLVRNAVPRHTVYTMGKGAIDRLTMVLAQQLGGRGITVNSVAPGAVETDMTAGWLRGNTEAEAQVTGITALRRVGQPEDIADIVAFLASERGRWVTGNWIDATGGQSL
jgi:NAD(P)-dependent dehydrogenase (short-subunit alcohol dehydrogenase family)